MRRIESQKDQAGSFTELRYSSAGEAKVGDTITWDGSRVGVVTGVDKWGVTAAGEWIAWSNIQSVVPRKTSSKTAAGEYRLWSNGFGDDDSATTEIWQTEDRGMEARCLQCDWTTSQFGNQTHELIALANNHERTVHGTTASVEERFDEPKRFDMPYPPNVTPEGPLWDEYTDHFVSLRPDLLPLDPTNLDRLDDFNHWLRNNGHDYDLGIRSSVKTAVTGKCPECYSTNVTKGDEKALRCRSCGNEFSRADSDKSGRGFGA